MSGVLPLEIVIKVTEYTVAHVKKDFHNSVSRSHFKIIYWIM